MDWGRNRNQANLKQEKSSPRREGYSAIIRRLINYAPAHLQQLDPLLDLLSSASLQTPHRDNFSQSVCGKTRKLAGKLWIDSCHASAVLEFQKVGLNPVQTVDAGRCERARV